MNKPTQRCESDRGPKTLKEDKVMSNKFSLRKYSKSTMCQKLYVRCMPLTKKGFLRFAFDLIAQMKLNIRLKRARKLPESIYDSIKRQPEEDLNKRP